MYKVNNNAQRGIKVFNLRSLLQKVCKCLFYACQSRLASLTYCIYDIEPKDALLYFKTFS